jgi:transposase
MKMGPGGLGGRRLSIGAVEPDLKQDVGPRSGNPRLLLQARECTSSFPVACQTARRRDGWERCAGIDIGKASLKATVRVQGGQGGKTRREVRTFGTTTPQLLRLRDWLVDEQVSLVGMESTGVFWKPVFYLLEDVFECWLLNARHLKKVPGRKSDVSDSEWIAELVAHGLVRPSFVPPRPIRRLRDLTRYRTALTQERTREVQRLQDLLEDAGIKLDCVVSDITGLSSRRMLAALVAGERDPKVLAGFAQGRMRPKIPDLQRALVGYFTDHHARLCRKMLDHPGVSEHVAEVIIAETGGDMSRFATPQRLASWAGMCPGNNESAGKHFSGRTRKGNRGLRGALGEAATAASRSKNTYLSARYRRLSARRGKKRAMVAVGHDILLAAWFILARDVDYHDLGADYFDIHIMDPRRKATRLTQQLQALGYRVTLERAA